MKKIHKGEHNYITYKKKAQLQKTIVMFLVAAAIFVLGLLLNKFEKSNVFTIVAALCILPAAKQLVNLIVMAPYHSVTEEAYQRILANTKECKKIYTDIVMTSSEKVMNLAFLVIIGDRVIGLTGREKENRGYIESYLRSSFRSRRYQGKVNIYEKEDAFLRQLKSAGGEVEEAEYVEWMEYLESLMV